MRRVACALVVALAVALAGCAHGTEPSTTIDLADPGRCTPVDVVADPEVAPLLDRLAGSFNSSSSAGANADADADADAERCTFVRVHAQESAEATTQLAEGWYDAEDVSPAPTLWVPASTAWTAVANARSVNGGGPAVLRPGRSFAYTPLVVAMPEPMARALGWPGRALGWRDLARVAARRQGWGALGHPEWGAFRLGKANPYWSTTGLLAMTAQVRLGEKTAKALEDSVIYYGDSPWVFLDNWRRLDEARRPLSYVSAVVTDRRAVDEYNERKPRTRLVAITPNETALASDYPMAPVHAPWITDAARAGAQAFVEYATTDDAQRSVLDAGLLAGIGRTNPASPAYVGAQSAQPYWDAIRKRARVLLVFDVSDSMGDPAEPRDPNSPPKIDWAKTALSDALSQLAPDDEVGLRVFTTDVANEAGRTWADVVPIGRLDRRRAALERAIARLEPRRGSPLYSATRGAYDSMAAELDPGRINGVVLLTDGYNEYDADDDRAALLAQLRGPVRMFTVAYSGEADLSSLRRIAQATDARAYDATDTRLIEEMLPAALANF